MVSRMRGATPEARFWRRVQVGSATECWRWIGYVDASGYGNFNLAGTALRAHRWSYEINVGPIPEGLAIDHLCSNRACVNPAHLEPVTQAENLRRGRERDPSSVTTHCKRGHEFTEANTLFRRNGRGQPFRRCRTCSNENKRAAYRASALSSEHGSVKGELDGA